MEWLWLSRRWPAWPTQRIPHPNPENQHACQTKTFLKGIFVWVAGSPASNAIRNMSGSQKELTSPAKSRTRTGTGSPSIFVLVQLLSPGPGGGPADEIPFASVDASSLLTI
eukprot:1142901-Pelagomonas_calceolata.AAC.4